MHRVENRLKRLARVGHLVLAKERTPALGEHGERLSQGGGRHGVLDGADVRVRRAVRVAGVGPGLVSVRVGDGAVRLVHRSEDVPERGGDLRVGILVAAPVPSPRAAALRAVLDRPGERRQVPERLDHHVQEAVVLPLQVAQAGAGSLFSLRRVGSRQVVQSLPRQRASVPPLRALFPGLPHGRLERRLQLVDREPVVVHGRAGGRPSRRLVRRGRRRGRRERQRRVFLLVNEAVLNRGSLLRGVRSLLRGASGAAGGHLRGFRRGSRVCLDRGDFHRGRLNSRLTVRVELAVLHLRLGRRVRLIVRLILRVGAGIHRERVLAELHHGRERRRGGRGGRAALIRGASGGRRTWGKRRLRRRRRRGQVHPVGTVTVNVWWVPRRRWDHPGGVAVGHLETRGYPRGRDAVGVMRRGVEGHRNAVGSDDHGRHPHGRHRRRVRRRRRVFVASL
mmetsp:Transcript_4219/g.15708  ORF Transcript_4219/g.15708 Transcript_4219/m.15708 type:complete len:450 (-) Transcript_4219:80-1429(-)